MRVKRDCKSDRIESEERLLALARARVSRSGVGGQRKEKAVEFPIKWIGVNQRTSHDN